jgi:hypothetical protein
MCVSVFVRKLRKTDGQYTWSRQGTNSSRHLIRGQFAIDRYLQHVTGFPVTSIATATRPVEIFALVIAAVAALVSIPGWCTSRVRPGTHRLRLARPTGQATLE